MKLDLPRDRLVALTDGVLAVASTLLVLELQPPPACEAIDTWPADTAPHHTSVPLTVAHPLQLRRTLVVAVVGAGKVATRSGTKVAAWTPRT